MSEMIFASQLVRGERRDLALLRRHPSEKSFGVQILAGDALTAQKAAAIVADSGADFVDLNAGCPIKDAVTKGCGARLIERIRNFEQVLGALISASRIPVTVKLRIGPSNNKINILETSKLAESVGVQGIAVHGRTTQQHYTGAADWQVIGQVVTQSSLPVLGNGDILTWYEAEDRLEISKAFGIMIGRGAMIKPWLFREIKEKKTWNITAAERLEVYRTLAGYMLEHFGSDDYGRKRATMFMAWHIDWLNRYCYLPSSQYRQQSREHPLLQTRLPRPTDQGSLERVLCCSDKKLQLEMANIIVSSVGLAGGQMQACHELGRLVEQTSLVPHES